jgi:hypothetical protein
MIFIAHRRNTIKDLIETDKSYGIEVDIRSKGKRLIISHDPFVDGVLFDQWIKFFNHKFLILNVKEEGLEEAVIQVMKIHSIEHFFFLDQSFPYIIKYAKLGFRSCAVRLSEFETISTVLNLSGMIDWVWVDCFSVFPLDKKSIHILKENGFKLCMVSPELQGRNPDIEIPILKEKLNSNLEHFHSVCTKRPDLWKI